MEKLITFILIAWLSFGVVGCATQGDNMHKTYIGPQGTTLNRVSNLKRLVFLPPRYEIDGKVSKDWSLETENQNVQENAIRYLEDWRDYRVKPASGQQAENASSIEDLRVRLLGLLSSSGQETKLPAETRAAIQRLATEYETDGVLVLGLRYEGLDAKRWGTVYGVTFFTLGFGLFPYIASLGTHYTAAIFDAKDGELVWYARSHGGSFDQPDAALYVGSLAFGSLPNALPQVMFDKP